MSLLFPGILLLSMAFDTAWGVGASAQGARPPGIKPRVSPGTFEQRIQTLPPGERQKVLDKLRQTLPTGFKPIVVNEKQMEKRIPKLQPAEKQMGLNKLEKDPPAGIEPSKEVMKRKLPNKGSAQYNYRAAKNSEKRRNLGGALIAYSKSLGGSDYLTASDANDAFDRIKDISSTLLRQSDKDYQNRQWQSCHKKLSEVFEAADSSHSAFYNKYKNLPGMAPHTGLMVGWLQMKKVEATQLYERNLITWGEDSYRKAREDGSWANARIPYETMKNSRYAGEVKKLEAYEWSRCIDNLEAAFKMPGGIVVDVMPWSDKIQRIHMASETADLLMEGESIESLTNSNEFKKELQSAKRILVTRDAGKEKGVVELEKVFPNKVVWQDPNVGEAGDTIDALSKQKFSLKDSTTVLLFPRNDSERILLGLDWSEDTRKRVWESAHGFLDQNSGMDVVNRGGFVERFFKKEDREPIHQRLLKALQEQKNVLIFFAHGGRNLLHTPDGKILTAEEVSKLDLRRNKPNVFLLNCEGGKPGEKSDASDSLQQAFKKAGANLVFAFEQKIDASTAITIASKLLEEMKSRTSILDAIEEIAREFQTRYSIRLKARLETDITQQDRRCA